MTYTLNIDTSIRTTALNLLLPSRHIDTTRHSDTTLHYYTGLEANTYPALSRERGIQFLDLDTEDLRGT